MNTFIKKLIHFSVGPVIGATISFITVPLTAYFISPEEYGKASLFLLLQVLLAAYLYLGIDQAYTREYHEVADKNLLLQNALVLPLGMATIISILFLFNMSYLSNFFWGDPKQNGPIIMLTLSMYGMIFERFLLLSIRMEEKAMLYSMFTILIKLLTLLVTLGVLLFWRKDFLSVIYGTIVGQLLSDIILLVIFHKKLRFRLKYYNKNLIKKLFLFGIPVFIAFSIEGIFTTIDRFSLKWFSNFKEVGLYTVALKVASLMKVFQSSFTSFWVPTAYRWYDENKPIYYYQRVSDAVVIVFSILFMIIMLFKGVIPIIFTEDYQYVIYIIPYILLVPIFYTVSETTTLGIVFMRKTHLNIWVSISAICINIVCIFIFVPIWGAKGAAISTGIAYFIYYCMRTFLSIKIWPGLKIKSQLMILFLLLISAGCNTFMGNTVWIINFLLLVYFIIIGFRYLHQYKIEKIQSKI
ncbi:oligosaccharide flippase family protein [Bacillus cereus]|nr:oligosaccharide flippase family protein [Bacillus cereus]MCM3222900.1 oligosaccharide flippase family protein [Bacillus cereus]MEC3336053.1 oligosaccharide flippase family protein [Bacillus cereus]TKH28860.1 polysaccharide biosynthesis protein [Bacillus cereus]